MVSILSTTTSRILFILLFFASALASFAQNNPALSVNMNGFRMRYPMETAQGESVLTLKNLVIGETYTVVAIGAAEGQQATFGLSAGPALRQAAGYQLLSTNVIRFKAFASEADFRLSAVSPHGESTLPMFLSVKCESCAEAKAAQQELLSRLAPAIQATPGTSPQTLISNVLIGGNCFSVSNINAFGNPNSRGTFTNGATSISIQEGMVLSTGNPNVVEGPNTEGDASDGFFNNSPDDADLNFLALGNQWDVTKIEFDFTPTSNFVQFEYVFGSEEYCEYVGTQFNDVFGFFISGPGITGTQNLAVINGNTPISINTVNHATNSNQYVNNDIYSSQCFGIAPFNLADCQLDGWTKKLTATASLQACQTYHIKLAIADVGDGFYDSAVFLKANSFNAGGSVSASPVYANNLASGYENCGQNYIKFSRGTGGNTAPLAITFSVSPTSTATSGVDYTPLPTSVVIPSGVNDVLIPVNILSDALAEGLEKIILAVDNLCSCDQGIVEFDIRDKDPLSLSLDDVTMCTNGATVTLEPDVTGGVPPLAYAWSTGQTTASILVDQSGNYHLSVTDGCGQVAEDSALVSLGSYVQTTTPISFCPGGSVTINGVIYTQPGTVLDTLAGAGSACDTIVTYNLSFLPSPTSTDTLAFCPGGSVTIGDSTYTEPTTVSVTLVGQNGACDTVLTYVLVQLTSLTSNDTIQFCPGSSVTLGDSTYTQPTTVSITLPGQNGGCDTLATYVLQLLPQITRTETLSFCPGDSVTVNGTVYTQSATVTINLDGQNGACDTLVTYDIIRLAQPTSSTAISLCPGASVTLGGTAYTAPNTVNLTLPGANGDCDTLATYVLQLLPQPTTSTTISLCPGASVELGGTEYLAPNTVTLTLPGANGACDTLASYQLVLLAQPTTFETVYFCPGQSVQINGVNYSAAGTVVDTLPNPAGGCDIIATYEIVPLTPAPSLVKIQCPPSVGVTIPAGNSGEVVTYNAPSASTDCVCPGLALNMTAGLASGSVFPVGTTQVCFTAEDSCGNSAACCFSVDVAETAPCDIKELGCMRWELLTITQNAALQKTYRIRFKNSCSEKMAYALIQLPNGVVAVEPPNGSQYTAPSGRKYKVTNPNLTTFYSIRFGSQTDSIANGQSEIFKYTLPAQSLPTYIHVAVRLNPRIYYEAHINTFYCPIGITPNATDPGDGTYSLRVSPNPSNGAVSVDLSAWAEQRVRIRVSDGRGQLVRLLDVRAEYAPQRLDLPEYLSDGIYFLEVLPPDGTKQSTRFIIAH